MATRNPADLTKRNNDARKRDLAHLRDSWGRHDRRLRDLEARVVFLEIKAGVRDARGRKT